MRRLHSTAGDGNGIQEAAQPESVAGIDWYFNEVEELQTRLPAGGSGEDGFTSQRNSFRTITESR